MENQPKKSKKPKIKVDYDKVENLAGRGLSKEQIAMCLGMTGRTLYRKQLDDPKFDAAIKKGKAAAIAAVTAQLFKNISLNNMTAIIFFLKCQGGWKETTVIENRDAPPIPGDECSPEEAEAAYIASMRAPKK